MPGSYLTRYRFTPSGTRIKLSGIVAKLPLFLRIAPASLTLNSSSVKSRISRVQAVRDMRTASDAPVSGVTSLRFCANIKCATPDPSVHSGSVRRPCGLLIFTRVSSRHVAAHEANRRGQAVSSPFPFSSYIRAERFLFVFLPAFAPFSSALRALRPLHSRRCRSPPERCSRRTCAVAPAAVKVSAAHSLSDAGTPLLPRAFSGGLRPSPSPAFFDGHELATSSANLFFVFRLLRSSHKGRSWESGFWVGSGVSLTHMSSELYLSESSGSKTPSVSFGEQASSNQCSDGLEAELARMESSSNVPEADTGKGQEASSSGQGSGVDLSSVTRGTWRGSDVKQPEIDWLYRSRRVPAGVIRRLPRGEVEPNPEPGEHVVFLAHFERGFGLPASDFFRSFLYFYELQPHHLPGNAVFYLSCYATFMEAYMALRPTRETFARFFSLWINSVQGKGIPYPKPPVQCGSCIIGSRQGSPFFKFSGLESCRAKDRFPRITAEKRGPPRKRLVDEVDPDPYVPPKELKMGRTHTSRPSNFSNRDSGSDDEVVILEVLERVVPLQAEVGPEFIDKLTGRGQKHKAPEPEAGSSHAPPAKRPKKPSKRQYKRREMPVAEGAQDLQECLRHPSGKLRRCHKVFASSSSKSDHRRRRTLSPENQDTAPRTRRYRCGKGGTFGSTVQEEEKKASALPPRPRRNFRAASSTPSQALPDARAAQDYNYASSGKLTGGSVAGKPTTPPSQEPVVASNKPASPASTGSLPRTAPGLHAAMPLWPRNAPALTGSPSEPSWRYLHPLPRSGIGRRSAQRWLGKDKMLAIDPLGPEHHVNTVRRAVKEFYTWHDATNNVVSFRKPPLRPLRPTSASFKLKRSSSSGITGRPWKPRRLSSGSSRISHPSRAPARSEPTDAKAAAEAKLAEVRRIPPTQRRLRADLEEAIKGEKQPKIRAFSGFPDSFHSLRRDAPTDTDPVLTAKRKDRAYQIAESAPIRTFIPAPPNVHDFLSDEEEEEEEEDEDAGDAPPEAGDAPPEAPEAGAAPPEAPVV
ncbi:hypothetical protein QYE76_002617 [Lolium multiflorum]|uniref:Transposase (putative) gypsy type domain-containing protein n=1 Tax=Lolium multiflorum TaxID=4521 RepID=A0AAD8RPZ4_LOLMU|nr:hypothetical protein QYE76_002617 [Lolium multiflorum]